MSRMGWRLRMLARRALPHTPAKRWAYGAAVAACLVLIGMGQPLAAAALILASAAVRIWDVRRGQARRGHRPNPRTYFFEGPDPFGNERSKDT